MSCPFCGKEPKRGQTHFSFSERGGKCFVCGETIGLVGLAKMHGLIDGRGDMPAGRARVTPRAAKRRQEPPADFGIWARRYADHYQAVERWQQYKPLPEEIIRAYGLGYGQHPVYTSQCQHDRLQVPLVAGGKVVGFRSRSVSCDCTKWLSPRGSRMILFHGERLGSSGGDLGIAMGRRRVREGVLYIVENPIDALLLEHLDDRVAAIATLGVANWKDHWTALVARARPMGVVVAYDNDRPGNGGGARGRIAWLRDHERDIEPNGVKLVNRLLRAGVQAKLFHWKESDPLKMDIGDVLREAYEQREAA